MGNGDNRSGSTDRFNDMSDADLVAFIGGGVDPNTNRADLIVLAIEADDARNQQRSR
ncbi:MAG: hypothetical protein JWL85_679 [Candidatus Saccharibacteria bacterium]|nr:hypothetical protein [Candidatus Saccharibacteria bacterium]